MRYLIMIALLAFAGGSQALATNVERPTVYPKNGQSPVQQGQDANGCRTWATQQTGVDPAYLEGQLSMVQSQDAGKRQMPIARGAIRGVAAGSALGAINGSMDDGTGKGAAMGVTAGAMRGLGKRIDTAREAKVQQSQQQAQNLKDQYATYNRAFSACMSGKGYSVG